MIFLFIAVWDDVWMKYGLSLDQKKLHGATKLFINSAEFVGIAIFSPRSWNNSMVGVINFMPWLMIT